jgi:hypothetical protein
LKRLESAIGTLGSKPHQGDESDSLRFAEPAKCSTLSPSFPPFALEKTTEEAELEES